MTRNVLVLYDQGSIHVATVKEHVESLSRHSRHNIFYLPATTFSPWPDIGRSPSFDAFDVLVLHYSVRLSLDQHIAAPIARAVEAFKGLKIVFMQDEYDTVDIAKRWLKRLDFDVMFTCIPKQFLPQIYPADEFPKLRFVETLTGYVPDDASIETYRRPLAERTVVIGYRGRVLPHQYGDLGQEKRWIGERVREAAKAKGIRIDIEVTNDERIYGPAWYDFLSRARATLGTESGSNVFDTDGALSRLAAEHADLSFEDFRRRFLAGREGPVRMNQISPKIFEAIRLRVALVLFEGTYSGVVQAGAHYIPLRKDLTNVDNVFAKLEDMTLLESLTERAYRDVVESGRYSYSVFVESVDREIDAWLPTRQAGSTTSSTPSSFVQVREDADEPAFRPSRQVLPAEASRPADPGQANAAGAPDRPQTLTAPAPPSRLSAFRARLERQPVVRGAVRGLARVWSVLPAGVRRSVRKIVG
jgi:hypothetical protein